MRSLKDKDEPELARPTGMGDLSRLTPPSYFSVLYDGNGQATYQPKTTSKDAPEDVEKGDDKTLIDIVRGVKVDQVEVSRP